MSRFGLRDDALIRVRRLGETTGVPPAGDPPPAPADLQVTGTTESSISLKWRNPSVTNIASVRLYRGTVSGSLQWHAATRVDLTPGAFFEYTDRWEVVTGVTYFYHLTAVDDEGRESAPGPEISTTVTGITLPGSFFIEYAFDEGAGLVANDRINDYDLTLGDSGYGTPGWTTPGPWLSFDGTNDVARYNSALPPGLGLDDKWTVALLIRMRDIVKEQVIYHAGRSSPQTRIALGIDTDQVTLYITGGDSTDVRAEHGFDISDSAMDSAAWWLLTVTFDGTTNTPKFYRNKANQPIFTPARALYRQRGQGIHFGAVRENDNLNYASFYNGDIAWAGLANEVLTPLQVSDQLYPHVYDIATAKGITGLPLP